MVDSQRVALEEAQPAELWPPDDTEESVLGTNLHQTTITNVRLALNEIAAAHPSPRGSRPWQALGQTMITGLQRPDGSRYTVLPDVFVYPRPIDDRRGSLALALDGPPALVIEVLSDATYRSDLDMERGKGYSYARAGVREYLVLDPIGEFVPEQVRGWRLEGDAYRPLAPDAQGRWQSREVGAAFSFAGVQVAVYGPQGQRQLREGEITQELERRDRQYAEALERRDRQYAEALARQEQELAALRDQVERLRRGQ